MTEEEINDVLAVWQTKNNKQLCSYFIRHYELICATLPEAPFSGSEFSMPRYTVSRDTVFEIESMLDDEQEEAYTKEMIRLLKEQKKGGYIEHTWEDFSWVSMCHPETRARVLVKVLGLQTD